MPIFAKNTVSKVPIFTKNAVSMMPIFAKKYGFKVPISAKVRIFANNWRRDNHLYHTDSQGLRANSHHENKKRREDEILGKSH